MKNKGINLKKFIRILDFSELPFHIYDIDKNEFISAPDITQILKNPKIEYLIYKIFIKETCVYIHIGKITQK